MKAAISIREWFERFGESVISAEGRGEGGIVSLGDNTYGFYMTDDDLNDCLERPRESLRDFNARVEREQRNQIVSGDTNIEAAAQWFAEKVSYSAQDKQEIIAAWRQWVAGKTSSQW